jgi:hypothetical protein
MIADRLPAEPDFPQLQTVSDPELMRDYFQAYLRPMTRRPRQVRSCKVSRVRYRQGSRCILHYTLLLVEPETGQEWSQWVSGTIYALAGRAARTWRKLRAADAGRPVADPARTFESSCFIPDLGMFVQVFPYDRYLPTLPSLLQGPLSDLEPQVLARLGSGDWTVLAWHVEPLRYWAGWRCVLRCFLKAREARSGRRLDKHFFLRLYRGDLGERTFRLQQRLWEQAECGGVGLSEAKPIAYLADRHLLVEQEVEGLPLKERLIEDPGALGAVRQAARGLATVHLAPLPLEARGGLRYDLGALGKRQHLLQWSCPDLGEAVGRVVGALTEGAAEGPSGPTHGDLKLDHLLVDGDRVALIDLDSFGKSNPLLDCASFLAELASLAACHNRSEDWLRTTGRAFAEEYFARVPSTWRSQLPLQYAGACLEVAAGFFLRQEPSWRRKAASLILEAETAVGGRVW